MKALPSKKLILLSGILILILAFIISALFLSHKKESPEVNDQTDSSAQSTQSDAETAGREFSHDNCTDTGPTTLTHMPMNEEDFAFIIPYGLVVGAHVTPIDHQYFSPAVFDSPRDTYEVYAMADGRIIEINFPALTDGVLAYFKLRLSSIFISLHPYIPAYYSVINSNC